MEHLACRQSTIRKSLLRAQAEQRTTCPSVYYYCTTKVDYFGYFKPPVREMPVVVVTPYKRYEIPNAAANKSQFLSEKASASSAEISLPEKFLTDMVMMNVISFLLGRESTCQVQQVEDDEVLLATVLAADYLQIPELFEMYSNLIINTLRTNNNAKEVRAKLKIKNDFTMDEEATTAKEDPWSTHAVNDDPQLPPEEEVNFLNLTEVEDTLIEEFMDPEDDMTVSMVVDGGTQHTHYAGSLYPSPSSNYHYGGKADIVQFVLPRKPVVPVPDSQVERCASHKCGARFTSYNRKHHCRHCGMLHHMSLRCITNF